MLIFKGCRRFARGGLVVVAFVLLCLVGCLTLLSLTAIGSQEDPSALAMANVLPLDQGANRDAPPLDGTYHPFAPFALADEADEAPVNSWLLTMLFLAAPFFGASIVGWLLTNAQRQRALCFSSLVVVGEVLGSAREPSLPFLGVFRL